jgi:hypothetical protein
MQDGRSGAGVYGQSEARRLSISLGKYVTIFQAEIHAILACVWEIQSRVRSERYVSALIVSGIGSTTGRENDVSFGKTVPEGVR